MTQKARLVLSAPLRKPAMELAPYAAKKPKPSNWIPEPYAAKKPVQSEASASVIFLPKKPLSRESNLSVPNTSTAAKPAPVQETAKTPLSSTNTYIDRTNYSIGATRRSDRPSAVVLTERSTGCQTVSQNGQLVSGVCGLAAPRPRILSQQTADSGKTLPNLQTAISGQTVQSLQSANSERTLPTLQIASSGRTLPSPLTANSRSISLDEAPNSRPTLQEPRRIGVSKLLTPPSVVKRFVKINPLKATTNVIRATDQTLASYTAAGVPLPFPSQSDYGANTSTTSTAQDYYNLTTRPAGRQSLGENTFMFPLTIPASINSLFGWRIHPITGDRRFHAGTDLAAPIGTPVLAAVAGQVLTADFLGGYGLTVILQHGQGLDESIYGHLSEIFVKAGEQVEQGTVIGRVGSTGNSTGPHLHFEWRHLTPGGWVAVDAGAHLEYSLAQFVRLLQIAQAAPQRGV
ncbi:MAG TPA: peptidase M23 [Cyanobacteria bacterium UBA8543]|nr:peptidase M23 [Cyanobacteria bacterium UBA8543]